MNETAQAKLLFVVAEGLDWAAFQAAVGAGIMPGLAGLAACPLHCSAHMGPGGAASLLSGVPPEAHGLWLEDEAWAGGTRPLSRASWQVAPLWLRLADAGIATASVAMPGSTPGASWPGTHFDSRLGDPDGKDAADWSLPLRVAPAAARDAIRDLRVHPTDIDPAQLAGLVSDLSLVDQSRDSSLAELAVLLARAGTVQAAATWLLAEGVAALFICFDWTGMLRHRFGGIRTPPFATVVPAGWQLLDAMLRALVAAAPAGMRLVFAAPGWEGRPGVLATDLAALPAAVNDVAVAPMVMAHFGLPWSPPAPLPAPPADDEALLAAALAGGGTRAAGASPHYHANRLAALAVIVARRDPARAIQIAEAALGHEAGHVRALRILASCLARCDRHDELPAVASRLRAAAPTRPWGALAEAAAHLDRQDRSAAALCLREVTADNDAESLFIAARLWVQAGQPAMAEKLLTGLLDSDRSSLSARLGLAAAAIAARDFATAEIWLTQLVQADPGNAAVHIEHARLYLATGRAARARAALAKARALGGDPDTLARLAAAGGEAP
ncbi:MAG: tetratricopeptide repeat protein [Polymorphobacter sp.]